MLSISKLASVTYSGKLDLLLLFVCAIYHMNNYCYAEIQCHSNVLLITKWNHIWAWRCDSVLVLFLPGGDAHLHTVQSSESSSILNLVGVSPVDAGTYKCVVGDFQSTVNVIVNSKNNKFIILRIYKCEIVWGKLDTESHQVFLHVTCLLL